MPIPTRSIPIRGPRKQHTKPSNVGGPATSETSSVTTTSSTDETPSHDAAASVNILGRNRSLLPVHDGRGMGTQQEGRLSQRTTKLVPKGQLQQRQEQTPAREPTVPTRRQSLIRPSQLKTPSYLKSTPVPTTTKKATIARAPPSPIKQQDTFRQNGRPLSPKKNDMPPPPRPTRSASLRQPASSSSGSPAVSRGHARHRSQVLTPASSQAPKKNETPQASSTTGTSRLRSQFTTFQQQFSSKKTAKPADTGGSVGTPEELDSSLIPSSWPEIAAMQTELLQVSLLHAISLQEKAKWEADAESQLRSKYDSVAGGYMAILDVEKESQRQLNGQAVHCWLMNSREHSGQQGFAEQIQRLSQVAQDVYDLSDSLGGRYAMIVQEFESWLQEVETIRHSRLQQVGEFGQLDFVDSLERGWKDEVQSLNMKLELSLRQLQSLDILGYGEVELLDGSSLLRTAKGLDEMIRLMLDELSAMCKIEADLVKSERTWVSQLAGDLTAAHYAQDERVPKVGMWRKRSSLKS